MHKVNDDDVSKVNGVNQWQCQTNWLAIFILHWILTYICPQDNDIFLVTRHTWAYIFATSQTTTHTTFHSNAVPRQLPVWNILFIINNNRPFKCQLSASLDSLVLSELESYLGRIKFSLEGFGIMEGIEETGNHKRRRSENHFNPRDNLSSDYYDNVLGATRGLSILESEETPRFSWLTSLHWFSSVQVLPVQNSRHLQSMDKRDIDDATEDTREVIKHISKQLIQVKRRLQPAAERSSARAAVHINTASYRDPHDFLSSDRHCRSESWGTGTGNSLGTTARDEFLEARRACNPLEVLGEGQQNGLNQMFMNRSAIKLANIDAALGFCIVNPPVQTEKARKKCLVFADLCGAPGGFSEYILWRCSSLNTPMTCRGYGMSLSGSNEQGRGIRWKLPEMMGSASPHQYRTCFGVDGTGDIHRWENVLALQQMMFQDDTIFQEEPNDVDNTQEWGRAHLVLADGGFDAQRDSENQEEIAQKLIVCQVTAALALLKSRGTLVVKVFGFQTPVIRVVMRHLFLSFDSMVAIKPISSRPASAERYVVCVGFHGNPSGWDGRHWSSQMYLQRPCLFMNSVLTSLSDYAKVERTFFRYLDEFDRDLVNLNLKACFAILSYLENKCERYAHLDYPEPGINLYNNDEVHSVNIASFKSAWRLVH